MCIMVNGQTLTGDITNGQRETQEKRWRNLSDASLMIGGFKAPALLLPSPLGAGDSKKTKTYTSLFIHPHTLSCVLIYLPNLFHRLSIPYSLCHLHNLACHAFVPLYVPLFSAYSVVFGPISCSLKGLMEWMEQARHCHFTIS